MTKPALPAGVQNLLDLHSMYAYWGVVAEHNPPRNNKWGWRIARQNIHLTTEQRIDAVKQYVCVHDTYNLSQWVGCVKHLEETWP